MKTKLKLAVGLALLSLVSCRNLVLEDRILCPRFMFFDLLNSESFESFERVCVSVYSYPEGLLLDKDTTTVRAIDNLEFYMAIRGEEAVSGHGLVGVGDNHLDGNSSWIIPEGSQADPIFRFTYLSATEPESFLVPVELVKDHSRIGLQFVGMESFVSADGEFPFLVRITGNTCGMDILTGNLVRGPFSFLPEELSIGRFECTLPRQADHALRLELYGKPELGEMEGLLGVFDLWAILYEQGGITWLEKNLPDADITIDYKEMSVRVSVSAWGQEQLDYNF